MSNAAATRERILQAATEEFAAHGIAGARVDRIAAASGASKPMLYAYFGSKDQLFDAVFLQHVVENGDRAPFDAEDLPSYAVRLYDEYLADPHLLPLIMWKRLERMPVGFLYSGLESEEARHVQDVRDRQRAGVLRDDIDPLDLYQLVLATAATWAQSSLTAVATPDEPEALHQRRRAALAETIAAATAASPNAGARTSRAHVRI